MTMGKGRARGHGKGALAIVAAVAFGSLGLFRETSFLAAKATKPSKIVLMATANKDAIQSTEIKAEVKEAWDSLFATPDEWLDYREHKKNGLVKSNYPDFRCKNSKAALYVEGRDVPADAREMLAQYGPGSLWAEGTPKTTAKAETSSKEQLWKALWSDPSEWTDYRTLKQLGEKKDGFPDFKSKTNSLWLDSKSLPDWVPGRLKNGALWKPALEARAIDKLWESLFADPSEWTDYRKLKASGDVKGSFPDFKSEKGSLWIDSKGVSDEILERLETAGELWNLPSTKVVGHVEKLWKSLFEDPSSWTDYRHVKQSGEVNNKFPDFKSKDGDSLWIQSRGLPEWVLDRLSKEGQLWSAPSNQVEAKELAAKSFRDNRWSPLFEDPSSWTDYRQLKQLGEVSGRHPDFKSKDGKGLWLDSDTIPDWVLEQLKKDDKLWFAPSQAEAKVLAATSFGEMLWRPLFEDPSSWTDYRELKQRGQVKGAYPDFKSKDGKSLWLDSKTLPDWVPAKLENAGKLWKQPTAPGTAQANPESMWDDIFSRPEEWIDFRSAKKEGKVSEKFPDFKHVSGQKAAWVDDRKTPLWVMEKLELGETPAWQQEGLLNGETAGQPN